MNRVILEASDGTRHGLKIPDYDHMTFSQFVGMVRFMWGEVAACCYRKVWKA